MYLPLPAPDEREAMSHELQAVLRDLVDLSLIGNQSHRAVCIAIQRIRSDAACGQQLLQQHALGRHTDILVTDHTAIGRPLRRRSQS
jgi:hypothetical protein